MKRILIIVLVIVGIYFLFFRDSEEEKPEPQPSAVETETTTPENITDNETPEKVTSSTGAVVDDDLNNNNDDEDTQTAFNEAVTQANFSEVYFSVQNVTQNYADAQKYGGKPGDVLRYRLYLKSETEDIKNFTPHIDISNIQIASEIIDTELGEIKNDKIVFPSITTEAPMEEVIKFLVRVKKDCGNISTIVAQSTGIITNVPLKCEKPKPRIDKPLYPKKQVEPSSEKVSENEAIDPEIVPEPKEIREPVYYEEIPVPVAQNLPLDPYRVSQTKVYLYEYEIDLSNKELPAGTIIFEVENSGQFSHEFAIRGIGNFGKIRPGERRSFSAVIGEGRYEIYSPRNRDIQYNMVEDFFVVE